MKGSFSVQVHGPLVLGCGCDLTGVDADRSPEVLAVKPPCGGISSMLGPQ